MTNDENDDRTDDDETDASGWIPLGNVLESVSRLLDELEELDLDTSGRRSGSVQRGDATFDYNINIGSINPAGESRRNRRRRRWDIRGESAEREYHVQVNEEEGELVVVADLPAVSDDDIDVQMNREAGTLEIRVDEELVESIPIDWEGATVADVTFQNKILEVHVEPPYDEDGSDEDTGDEERQP